MVPTVIQDDGPCTTTISINADDALKLASAWELIIQETEKEETTEKPNNTKFLLKESRPIFIQIWTFINS